jgi:hypothetical protein
MATTISSSISEKPFLFPHLYFLPSLVFEILLVTNDAVVRVNAPASPKSGGGRQLPRSAMEVLYYQ